MTWLTKASKILKTLGPTRVTLYTAYRIGLAMGWWRRATHSRSVDLAEVPSVQGTLFEVPTPQHLRAILGPDESAQAIALADEIVQGKYRPFGGTPAPLILDPPQPLEPWDRYGSTVGGKDIKEYWEAARLGWVFILGRAYILSEDENYAQACQRYLDHFLGANPVGFGPNWASGQEVALRIPALLFALQVFKTSVFFKVEFQHQLTLAILEHARRIPPTLIYAQAQDNNHLLSEALGLYLAGVMLPKWPEAPKWREMGWYWLNRGFQHQISAEGCYAQNSLNYHRLMLHLALLFARAARIERRDLPPPTLERLAKAVCWLWARMDEVSGTVPNYGHNDGSNVLPFGSHDILDYRPTLQAAGEVFLRSRYLPVGMWDELGLWLGAQSRGTNLISHKCFFPGILKPRGEATWALLYGGMCQGRVAHADYLHVDLWDEGTNLLLDPGTYAYNLSSPWDNGLAKTLVHNTLRVDERDQLERLGRFLWDNKATVRFLPERCKPDQRWVAEHDGYRALGLIHRRTLSWLGGKHWQVIDEVIPVNKKGDQVHCFDLHWLIRMGEWQWDGPRLWVVYPELKKQVHLRVTWEADEGRIQAFAQRLVCQGSVVAGPEGKFDLLGWYSPTYLVRVPALSFLLSWRGCAPLKLVTDIEVGMQG
ncbi:alginate lyase family protein [uncultured Thermanaerothrix sp.]|uniref:alginate lyase family protein n=1 Tax=uncultured Thermanaerothrix sp. TaxID=1195149 RepID=UPI00260A97CA|nr:alginate lyase family protein [uncultured Thermanaerothrix sp.]